MPSETPTPKSIRYMDLPELRESFVDQTRTIQFDGSTLKFEFVTARVYRLSDIETEYAFVPAARLVMPINTAIDLHQRLADVLQQMESAGVIQRLAPAPGTTQ